MSPITALVILALALIGADLVRVIVLAVVGPHALPTSEGKLDLTERQARLRTIIDIACASSGLQDRTCEWLYLHCRDDARALELWESLGKAGATPYDPWATTPSATTLQYRIGQWLKHPGFPTDC